VGFLGGWWDGGMWRFGIVEIGGLKDGYLCFLVECWFK
jgi:hypothetical protein